MDLKKTQNPQSQSNKGFTGPNYITVKVSFQKVSEKYNG